MMTRSQYINTATCMQADADELTKASFRRLPCRLIPGNAKAKSRATSEREKPIRRSN